MLITHTNLSLSEEGQQLRLSHQRSWESPDLGVLSDHLPPAPVFPRSILGGFWSEWCDEASAAANAPFDYVGAALLTVAGSLIGNSRFARVGDWIEPPLLWTALVGEPSTNKSPALDGLTELVRDLASEEGEESFLLNDATPRATADAASESSKGNLLLRDELAGWFKTFGQAGGEQFWLQAFGARPHTLRRANGQRIHVERLATSVLGGTQPDMVKDLLGRPNTGFASRLLYVVPEANNRFRLTRGVNNALAFDALARLWSLTGRSACQIEEEVLGRLEGWMQDNIDACAVEDGLLSQWLAKQRGIALRLSLIHDHLIWAAEAPLAEPPPQTISKGGFNAACEFIDSYATPMARRAFALSHAAPDLRGARLLANLLRRHRVDRFNASRVRRSEFGPVGELRDSKAMSMACEVLEAAYLIRSVGVRAGGGAGRRPQDFVVNPALHTGRGA